MFDFGDANEGQRQAISTVDGPVLITAGPGTGKTYTLVQRAIYLVEECGVSAENLFIATFTEKAARELVTRMTNELARRHITVNMNEMYVGTFHSLCLRILKDHLEYTRLRKNYRQLDEFDQTYTVYRNLDQFLALPGVEALLGAGTSWGKAQRICSWVNTLAEELVPPEVLMGDKEEDIAALGRVLGLYQQILRENNLMDFSSIQTETWRLLTEHPEILEALQAKLTYLMVDEYQDTNYIQEQLVLLLAGARKNICVVGDDDQGLYRFRGATIRNILEFPQRFAPGECRVIPLVVNYRSNSDIVDFYNRWMDLPNVYEFHFEWGRFRHEKRIVPHESALGSPAVVKLSTEMDETGWRERILAFILRLKESGRITDYNQVAFLFNSVKNFRVKKLAEFLEQHHINVYSPRSAMFFERFEIRLALGCLMLMFPRYADKLKRGAFTALPDEPELYYRRCLGTASYVLRQPEHARLAAWIRRMGDIHEALDGSTDYAYAGLLYRLFAYPPFKDLLKVNLGAGMVGVRPERNLAKLSQLIGKFEYLHQVDTLNGKYIDSGTERFFNVYLRLLYEGGIAEYEDDSEYAPSGCVSFLTIHQAKGLEFPIVFVDSMRNTPRQRENRLMDRVGARYFRRPAFEPWDQTRFFDFWRLYYTAFSRAQDLLVLTCNEDNREPSKYFWPLYEDLSDVDDPVFHLEEFTFHPVKEVNLKKTFSFTSHIMVYETCPRQYKFYKELEFMPVRVNAMLFGTLVHETIEDIHRAAICQEEWRITPENIAGWLEANYGSLAESTHAYLSEPARQRALAQVLRYVERQHGDWHAIQQAEVDVSVVEPDYILEGKIDLIRGEGDTVEIVDFKSEKKPEVDASGERLERYRRQLHVYAHLVEERTGKKVSRMHLYYTGEEEAPTITFPYTRSAIEGTMSAFDDTVHHILRRDFRRRAADARTCANCDFRYFCGKRRKGKGEPGAAGR